MHELQLLQGDPAALGHQVQHLAAHHAPVASRLAQQLLDLQQHRLPPLEAGRRGSRGIEGLGEQAVPGQNGGGFVELLVAGGLAPAQVIVIHGRQIVVDQGVGMDHFQGAGQRQGRIEAAAHRLRRRQAEDGPQPFATREQAVMHGLNHPQGRAPHRREASLQSPVDQGAPLF